MMKVEAVIRPERLEQVKNNLEQVNAVGMTVFDVHGRGEQRGMEFVNRAGKFRVDFLPKTKIEVVVDDSEVESVVEAICRGAKTGEMGDGKIFICPVGKVIRIRTGERDKHAI